MSEFKNGLLLIGTKRFKMRTRSRRRIQGSSNVLALVVIGALVCAFLLGFWCAGRQAVSGQDAQQAPDTQAVIDFLGKPIPVPAGSQEVKTFDMEKGGGDGLVTWGRWIVLDVTNMKPGEIQDIMLWYGWYFEKNLPFGLSSSAEARELYKSVRDGFQFGGGLGWTWGWKGRFDGRYCGLNMDAEVFDYGKEIPKYGSFVRIPVKHLTDPVQGQRILWIRLSFRGSGLRGQGKWPGL